MRRLDYIRQLSDSEFIDFIISLNFSQIECEWCGKECPHACSQGCDINLDAGEVCPYTDEDIVKSWLEKNIF